MKTLFEGEKRDIAVTVKRNYGSGAIDLTAPQRRILDSKRVLITGYDWAAATWDASNNELYTLFDSTLAGLSAPGTYLVQLRGTIGTELYVREVTVQVRNLGP